jgi:hypothetical protein
MAPILIGSPEVCAWTTVADNPTSTAAPANLAIEDKDIALLPPTP